MTSIDLQRVRGLPIDTNLLVLLVVELVSATAIVGNKRLSAYTTTDYQLLLSFVERFKSLFIPYILTEVSNLIGCETKQQQQRLKIHKRLAQEIEGVLPASSGTMSL
jgi:hypothetical protein